MILGDFGSLARLSFGSSLLLPALCYSCAAFEFMRRQSSNQALQLTPFDCRSGQANWAGTMTRFDFMRQLSKLPTVGKSIGKGKSNGYCSQSTHNGHR